MAQVLERIDEMLAQTGYEGVQLTAENWRELVVQTFLRINSLWAALGRTFRFLLTKEKTETDRERLVEGFLSC